MKEQKESHVPAKSETAIREEEVLAFWNKQGIFEKSLEKNAPEGEFVFYDGPPFATGLPHMGHLLGSSIKDVVGRYKTMRGYRVARTWGWDCHGLPVENIVEKQLELKSKKDIEAMGIDRFNTEARRAVLTFVEDWKKYVERLGRWVDFDHSYKTMDTSYIESVWWALKKIHDDGRLYEGRKVLMFCPRCETPLSKAEIAMDNSYKDVTDTAVYVKFRVTSNEGRVTSNEYRVTSDELRVESNEYRGTRNEERVQSDEGRVESNEERGKSTEYRVTSDEGRVTSDEKREASDGTDAVRVQLGLPNDGKPIYIVAWTTTPWTLPGNVALAVHPNERYILWKKNGDLLITEYTRAVELAKDGEGDANIEIVKEYKGSDLIGLAYEPLYDIPKANMMGSEKAWTVQAADFVTTEDGTGVVHIAPMYGEDDYVLGVEHGFPIVPILDATGTYNTDAPELVRGMYFKKGGKLVLEDLETRGLVFAKHAHTHSYPHCYRCGTALIYNALTSWFIDIQSIKKRLLEANEEVSWYPEHLKEGRFRNIIEGAPDWTISRNRFWASPLPIWKHETTGEVRVIGSLTELRAHTRTSGNTYVMVRHGEAESNVTHTISARVENEHRVTAKGREQVASALAALKEKNITKILASPMLRTRETAEHIATALNMSSSDIIYDDRLIEWQLGTLEGKPVSMLKEVCPTYEDRFTRGCGAGETLMEMKRRIGAALYEYEHTYANETILLVGHEYTLWLAECVAQGASVETCIEIRGIADDYVANGEVRVLDFVPLPHNKEYELDLHRPYIDDLQLVAEDGARLYRIPEVVDCWVESGLMPVASQHVLAEQFGKPARYPGDFIAEYIAQTRTWFYYMHAMGVLLFDRPSFTHCVTTGTILAEDGSKMSKSKGNFTDPLVNLNRYGADALRLYMLGSVVMQSEDMSFRDDELKEVHNRFIGILWNSYKFYEMYAQEDATHTSFSEAHVLDRWIIARLRDVLVEVTDHMDSYDTVRSVRVLREFVSDFSTWYIRRSRDRFKSDDPIDRGAAIGTTAYVLRTFATVCAPIAPFIAEKVYRGAGGEKESVHLAEWPEPVQQPDTTLIADMAEVRRTVSLALEARQRAGIKVRQPLSSLTLSSSALVDKDELLVILAEEVNVKKVQFGSGFEGEVFLDTVLTPELKREGEVRDLVRAVQELRKQASLAQEDRVTLMVSTDDMGKDVADAAHGELARVAGVQEVLHRSGVSADETEVRAGDTTLRIAIRKNDSR